MRETYLEGVFFGQRHPNFCWDDYNLARKIKRLEKKYHRLCVKQANGEISPALYKQEDDKLTKRIEKLIKARNAAPNKTGVFEITYCDLAFVLSYNEDFVPLDLI